MSKKKIAMVAIVWILLALAASFVINLLFKIKSKGVFLAEWGPGDALAYVGAVLGSISTFVLGYIAYKQNDKLQKMEENNYIANNSGMLLVDRITIKPNASIPVNYDIHSEQLLKEKENEDDCPLGYNLTITGSPLSNSVPAMIHVDSCIIAVGPEDCPYIISANSINDAYSRTAINNKFIRFSMTIMLARKNKNAFEEAIKADRNMSVEFKFNVVTDKYVSTTCKCRSHCSYQKINENVSWHSNDPMMFFYGNEILDRNSINIAGEETKSGQS